jgi:FMN phosphatase YigB (HAD superfamily)
MISVVFFDIGDTLGAVELSSTGDRIERVVVLPNVPGVLREMDELGVRLGIISNRGSVPEAEVKRALQECGLLSFFAPPLIIFGPKNSSEIFLQAAELAYCAAQECPFVGENQAERDFATAAGLRVAAAPVEALHALQGSDSDPAH